MPKIDITRTELVWPGKYDEAGALVPPRRVSLPFQVIERVSETRATRAQRQERLAGHVGTLFDYWQAEETAFAAPSASQISEVSETSEISPVAPAWRNKLIWGDNLYIMGSLLEHFAGKVDLIYIDPPFATGADFSFKAEIGGEEITKEQSVIEEKAYRDTWGRGLDSYLQMLWDRMILMKDLLAPKGSIYVHVGPGISSYVKTLMDQVFGADKFLNEIIWKRTSAHNDPKRYGVIGDSLLFYANGPEWTWNNPKTEYDGWYVERYYRYVDEKGRRFLSRDLTAPAHGRQSGIYEWKGKWPPRGRMWAYTQENMERLEREGRLFYTEQGIPRLKQFLEEMDGAPIQSIWDDVLPIVSWSQESHGYQTQKPEALLERVIQASSNENDLVADFFCGSGTTLAVAEKLGRRWIGCDLGRYAVHTTRKRLMDIPGCRPFEVLNLGRYERQVWQGVAFAGQRQSQHLLIFEYLKFILELYGAQPLAGTQHLHGKKGRALVHVGAVDAPVTIDEINACLAECRAMGQKELHVLGWEWEMGLANMMVDVAKAQGVRLLLLAIPREVMEQQAVDKRDIHFYELAYLEAKIVLQGRRATVTLSDFVIPNDELIPPDVRAKIAKWSDYVDYWAVDWDFQSDAFVNGWTSYRTRRNRALQLSSEPHDYPAAGRYRLLVKVIDIFGNDTSQVFDVEVA